MFYMNKVEHQLKCGQIKVENFTMDQLNHGQKKYE